MIMSPYSRAFAAALVCSVMFTAVAPAHASDDGSENLMTTMLNAVGMNPFDDETKDKIDYREHPPLVLPPNTKQLPRPAAASAAERNPNWPQDPDVARRNKAARAARAPMQQINPNANPALTKAELMQGRIDARVDPEVAAAAECGAYSGVARCLYASPDQMAAKKEDEKAEIPVGQEPDRLYLTQPPKGYMRATQKVKATFEAPRVAADSADPKAYLRRERGLPE